METTNIKIKATITCIYGSFTTGDIARGIPAAYADYLVDDLGVAERIKPTAPPPEAPLPEPASIEAVADAPPPETVIAEAPAVDQPQEAPPQVTETAESAAQASPAKKQPSKKKDA